MVGNFDLGLVDSLHLSCTRRSTNMEDLLKLNRHWVEDLLLLQVLRVLQRTRAVI
ncbi:hypothetical protein Ccrd_001043 [Cynara cardunculus var. scolymus]|uniref:Uncharacterized protein n=1 Tax=Cynara cardunculus var. scolymus TaxID=59895 RepID=A0A118JY43_CYNCS|nr:hypothetical protein Ccrd_001043 [Cynara cardunculus var. scolymus]